MRKKLSILCLENRTLETTPAIGVEIWELFLFVALETSSRRVNKLSKVRSRIERLIKTHLALLYLGGFYDRHIKIERKNNKSKLEFNLAIELERVELSSDTYKVSALTTEL